MATRQWLSLPSMQSMLSLVVWGTQFAKAATDIADELLTTVTAFLLFCLRYRLARGCDAPDCRA